MVAAGDAPADATATDALDLFRPERVVTRPFLFIVLEAERPLGGGARFGLAGVDEVLIGRGPLRQATRARVAGKTRLSVAVNSSYLSSMHARLSEEQAGWTIEDLNSRNGVFVNGQQVTRAVLSPGDVVALGRVFFLVEYDELPAASENDPSASDMDVGDASVNNDELGLLTLLPSLASRLD